MEIVRRGYEPKDQVEFGPKARGKVNNQSGKERCPVSTAEHIMDNVERRTSFPQMGAPLSSVAEVETDYRFPVCGSYLAFYRVVGGGVYVDRILCGARDYLKILFGNMERND